MRWESASAMRSISSFEFLALGLADAAAGCQQPNVVAAAVMLHTLLAA